MIAEFLGMGTRRRGEGRMSLENPSVSLQDPAAWDELFGSGSKTEAGININHSKALRLSPVWQGVSKLSGDTAKLGLDLFKRIGEDGRELDSKHKSYRLVRRKANREVSAFIFWRRMMTHAVLWNNGYAYIDRNGRGEPIELINMLPDRTAPERLASGQLVYVTEAGGKLRTLMPDQVFHLEGLCVDNLAGCDLVEKARDDIALGLAAIKFASKFFANGSRTGGILELPLGMTKKARDTVEEGFSKHVANSDNAFKTVVLRDGAKFHQTTIPPNEGQMTESRKEQVREVARWLNMAPSRLGDESGVSYKSKEEDARDYLDCTLSIWLTAICAEAYIKLLSPAEQEADSHYFEHNLNTLLRADPVSRFSTYAIAIRNGIMNPNEVRSKENMNPRKGGDEYAAQNPLPGQGPPAGGKGTEPPKPPPEPAEEKSAHLRRRVMFNACARARHKSKNPAAFLEWIDGDLRSHREEYRTLLGAEGEQEFFAEFIDGLRKIADTATADQLPGIVDGYATEYETKE